jgi:hypothetical protein
MNAITLPLDGKKYLAGVVTVRRSEVVGHRQSQRHRNKFNISVLEWRRTKSCELRIL